MDWTPSFRAIMTDIATQNGRTYDQQLAAQGITGRRRLQVDRSSWWRRLRHH